MRSKPVTFCIRLEMETPLGRSDTVESIHVGSEEQAIRSGVGDMIGVAVSRQGFGDPVRILAQAIVSMAVYRGRSFSESENAFIEAARDFLDRKEKTP